MAKNRADGFLGASYFVIGALISIDGITNSNQMVQKGQIQPILGILTMLLAMEMIQR